MGQTHSLLVPNHFGLLQRGKTLDRLSGFLLSEAQFVLILQVEPKFRTGAIEMGESQRRVSGNGALSVQNLRNPGRGYAEVARKFRGAHAERSNLFGQMFAGMNCG